jgi:hypothetical protein
MKKLKNYVIEDWTDYNKSKINSITEEYYAKKGVEAFDSSNKQDIIPSAITNCYPHALSVAKLLKAQLDSIKIKQDKIYILECGTGSGIFARHFLMACRELKMLDRIVYLISDIACKTLHQIKERNILADFREDVNYKLITLNLMNWESAKDINGNLFEMPALGMTILNYVLDALPANVLKRNTENNAKTDFKKIQLRLSAPSKSKVDFMVDTDYLKRLKVEKRWVNYEIDQQNELEQKYFDEFKIAVEDRDKDEILHYNYGSINALKILEDKTVECGLIYSLDVPFSRNMKEFKYQTYGNAIAHAVDLDIVKSTCDAEVFQKLFVKDHLFHRLILSKSSNDQSFNEALLETIKDIFVENNDTNVFFELKNALSVIKSPQAHRIYKMVVDELAKLDDKSASYHYYNGRYYERTKNITEALEHYKKAQQLDFINEYRLQTKILDLGMKV